MLYARGLSVYCVAGVRVGVRVCLVGCVLVFGWNGVCLVMCVCVCACVCVRVFVFVVGWSIGCV